MRSPVLPGLYADPNIAEFDGTYYIYATTDGFAGWGGKEFYVWKSTDLVDWERSEQPFLTLDGANGNVPWATGNAWAPTIIERDGKYYFYFSGHNAALNRKTIGVAVADSPEGPFTAAAGRDDPQQRGGHLRPGDRPGGVQGPRDRQVLPVLGQRVTGLRRAGRRHGVDQAGHHQARSPA